MDGVSIKRDMDTNERALYSNLRSRKRDQNNVRFIKKDSDNNGNSTKRKGQSSQQGGANNKHDQLEDKSHRRKNNQCYNKNNI